MTDLLLVLPDFPAHSFSHLLPSLEKNLLTVTDLLVLDAVDVAKRAQLPVGEVQRLVEAVVRQLHGQLGTGASTEVRGDGVSADDMTTAAHGRWEAISVLDDKLDTALGGGIPAGYIVEVTGESGAGKTQFLLTLLLTVQLSPPRGLGKAALYISTESPLPTGRVSQILANHPSLNSLPANNRPSLSRILSIQTQDLESQDHILRYQLPVAIKRHDVGLVVLDSVAANFRAEFDQSAPGRRLVGMAKRSAELIRLGAVLRDIARIHKVAIVVANQVADRFGPAMSRDGEVLARKRRQAGEAASTWQTETQFQPPGSPAPPSGSANLSMAQQPLDEPLRLRPGQTEVSFIEKLRLDHQQRWFTGWGDTPPQGSGRFGDKALKTPSLGLTWTNQISCRIALIKTPVYADAFRGQDPGDIGTDQRAATSPELIKWLRWVKVVFAPWVTPTESHSGVEIEILDRGIRSIEGSQ